MAKQKINELINELSEYDKQKKGTKKIIESVINDKILFDEAWETVKSNYGKDALSQFVIDTIRFTEKDCNKYKNKCEDLVITKLFTLASVLLQCGEEKMDYKSLYFKATGVDFKKSTENTTNNSSERPITKSQLLELKNNSIDKIKKFNLAVQEENKNKLNIDSEYLYQLQKNIELQQNTIKYIDNYKIKIPQNNDNNDNNSILANVDLNNNDDTNDFNNKTGLHYDDADNTQ